MNCPTCNKPGYAKEPGFHCENCGTYESVHADQCKVPALVPAVVLLLGAVDTLLDVLPADDESRRGPSRETATVAVKLARANVRRILKSERD